MAISLRERIARLRSEAGDDSRLREILDMMDLLEGQVRRSRAEQARLEERLARLENSVVFRILRSVGQTGANTRGRLGQALLRSPLHPLYAKLTGARISAVDAGYAAWMEAERAGTPPLSTQTGQSRNWVYQPRISILMPVYRPRREWIEAAIASVQAQTYENWQLCVCCDGPAEPWLDDWLRRRVVVADPRVRVAFAAERCGIASALNGAATLADGDYVTFLDQDDVLSPSALHFVVEPMQDETADVYYSDEDWIDESGRRIRPNFKPGWSPELLAGCMYFGHLFVVRKELLDELGSFRDGFDGAQDYDLALRLVGAGAHPPHRARAVSLALA